MMRALPSVRRLLGGSGVTFENAFASYPLCCPSRATFLTGQYAHNHGAKGNTRGSGGAYQSLIDPERNLAAWLDAAGYDTAFAGKWLNGLRSPRTAAAGLGRVDRARRGRGRGPVLVLRLRRLRRARKVAPLRQRRARLPDGRADARVRAAVRRGSRDRPRSVLPLAVAAPAPRRARPPRRRGPALLARPSRPARRRAERDPAGALREPLHAGAGAAAPVVRRARPLRQAGLRRQARPRSTSGRWRRSTAAIAAGSRHCSRSTTRSPTSWPSCAVPDRLESTTIVFTADQGILAGEHRLRGKNLPYEEAIRVPLVVRSPGVRAGTVNADPVVNADLAPTILDLAGVGVPDELARVFDGVSLRAAMQGDESPGRARDPARGPQGGGAGAPRIQGPLLRRRADRPLHLRRAPARPGRERRRGHRARDRRRPHDRPRAL